MQSTIGSTIFAVISWIVLASGAFWKKKSKKEQNAVTWVVVILVLISCYHAAVASVIQLLHIPVNIISIGLFDFIGGIFLWYQIWKKKGERQKYKVESIDIWSMVVFFICFAVVFVVRYHGTELRLTFATIDPAAHIKAAQDVIKNQYVQNMFYSALENGLFIETFAPFVRLDYTYKLFVMTEIYHLLLSGMAFYAAVRSLGKDWFLKSGILLLSIVYMFGYPLLSMIYGFVYLGLGVTLVCIIIILTNFLLQDEWKSKNWMIALLSMACYGLFECYVLFVPVTYVSVITGIFVMQKRQKKLVSKETVHICLKTFLLPCIFGLVYTYAGIFLEKNLTVSSQIATEGACYRDLYSNFLPFLPLALFGCIKLFEKKENCVEKYLFVYTGIFIGSLFLMGMTGKVSSYYYYKNYHLMWLLVFLLLLQGVAYVDRKSRALIGCYGIVTVLLVGMLVTNLEARIQARAELFDPVNKSVALNDIWSFNKENFNSNGYSEEKQELYHQVYEKLLQNQEKQVAVVCGWEDSYWYEAITGQRLKKCAYDKPKAKKNIRWVKQKDYVLVLTDSEMYEYKQTYYDSLQRIFENKSGFIARIRK